MTPSRFKPAHVAARWPLVPMTGMRGGGFVFDTNMVHKGEVDGNQSRSTIVLEFHPHGKIPHLAGFHGPCPSSARVVPSGSAGEEGFELYPSEAKTST